MSYSVRVGHIAPSMRSNVCSDNPVLGWVGHIELGVCMNSLSGNVGMVRRATKRVTKKQTKKKRP